MKILLRNTVVYLFCVVSLGWGCAGTASAHNNVVINSNIERISNNSKQIDRLAFNYLKLESKIKSLESKIRSRQPEKCHEKKTKIIN